MQLPQISMAISRGLFDRAVETIVPVVESKSSVVQGVPFRMQKSKQPGCAGSHQLNAS